MDLHRMRSGKGRDGSIRRTGMTPPAPLPHLGLSLGDQLTILFFHAHGLSLEAISSRMSRSVAVIERVVLRRRFFDPSFARSKRSVNKNKPVTSKGLATTKGIQCDL